MCAACPTTCAVAGNRQLVWAYLNIYIYVCIHKVLGAAMCRRRCVLPPFGCVDMNSIFCCCACESLPCFYFGRYATNHRRNPNIVDAACGERRGSSWCCWLIHKQNHIEIATISQTHSTTTTAQQHTIYTKLYTNTHTARHHLAFRVKQTVSKRRLCSSSAIRPTRQSSARSQYSRIWPSIVYRNRPNDQ